MVNRYNPSSRGQAAGGQAAGGQAAGAEQPVPKSPGQQVAEQPPDKIQLEAIAEEAED